MVSGKADLACVGPIAGMPVRCISGQMQMQCHTGYTLPERHVRDLELLRAGLAAHMENSDGASA